MLMKSISGLISWYDILYILLLAASFIYYFKFSSAALRNAKTLSLPIKWTLIGISIILFLISQTASIITYYHQQTDAWGEVRKSLSSQIRDRLNPAADPANRVMFQREGLVIYLSRSAWTVVDDLFITKSDIDLSDKEISEIDNYINTAVPIADTDTFASNKGKNIILILVESLNSYVIDKEINGHEITPTLNALAKAEGSITALNVRSQIKDGISHDGQLIINTGLLPIDKGVAMMEYGNREYIPSLPRMLPVKNSTVIFADNGRNYRKSDAFQALGFNNIISNDEFIDEAERIGRDAAMFNKAKTVVQSLSARNDSIPFFLELHTISTHAPFIEKGVEAPEWLKNAKNLDKRELNYFTTINYFDTVLGSFIEFLKETGEWDNTVITVMADHSCFSAMGHLDNPENLQLDYTEIPCAFIAANTGITKKITAPVGQVNIFPTILYLMGAIPETGYRGLGRTLLDSQLKSVVDSRGKVWGEASEE